MKIYQFYLDSYQADWIFRPIRSKKDSLVILMRAMKIMAINEKLADDLRKGTLFLRVDKMSRLFFASERKIFSINFPFSVSEIDGVLFFKSHSHPDVDNQATSEILALIDSAKVFESTDFIEFMDPVDDACVMDNRLWGLLRDLLTSEDGYIRYDFDAEHEDGHRHPLHHLDIFYSTSTTFKLGLSKAIDHQYFADVLTLSTDCHYLEPAR